MKLEHDTLTAGDGLNITFQRTLRIPDDHRTWRLPPGFGPFPLRAVDALPHAPGWMREKGGVVLPMFQREAMWLSFHAPKPHALKVAVGKVCALTGKSWTDAKLRRKKQDYLVTPPQPWLDGICTGPGTIRQFVAMPLGSGTTVEGQVTGEETVGGLQLLVVPPKKGRFDVPKTRVRRRACAAPAPAAMMSLDAECNAGSSMGLAAGGSMKQKLYPDPHGVDTWDLARSERLFVHIVDSRTWTELTGEAMPASPVHAKAYQKAGFPWFDLYDEHLTGLDSTPKLKKVRSLGSLLAELRDGSW